MIKNLLDGAMMRRNPLRYFGVVILAIFVLSLQSCRTVECPDGQINNCNSDNEDELSSASKFLWDLELRSEYRNREDKLFIQAANSTILSKAVRSNFAFTSPIRPTVRLYQGQYIVEVIYFDYDIYRSYGKEIFNPKSDYISNNKITITFSAGDSDFTPDKIFLLTSQADSDKKPFEEKLIPGTECFCCDRDRTCIKEKTGFIDKLELRLMGAYRFGVQDSLIYPGSDGGSIYYKETFGTGRGGTDFTAGLELAFLFNSGFLLGLDEENRDNFQLGFMTGIYPVDGALFLPLSLHPRYTFDDDALPLINDCDAWYIFADIGTVWAPFDDVPIICTSDNCDDVYSYMLGIGIGYDWWMTKCMDFSIDIGFRTTHFPLPENNECSTCTGLDGKYPFRTSNQVFIRLGLTF